MNMILWIVAGGLLGMGIAHISKGKKSGGFYASVISGVFFIIVSSYVIVPYIRDYADIARPLLFSLMSLCGIGYMILTQKNRIYR